MEKDSKIALDYYSQAAKLGNVVSQQSFDRISQAIFGGPHYMFQAKKTRRRNNSLIDEKKIIQEMAKQDPRIKDNPELAKLGNLGSIKNVIRNFENFEKESYPKNLKGNVTRRNSF